MEDQLEELSVAEGSHEYLTTAEMEEKIVHYQKLMKQASKELHFEEAIKYRDLMRKYQQLEIS